MDGTSFQPCNMLNTKQAKKIHVVLKPKLSRDLGKHRSNRAERNVNTQSAQATGLYGKAFGCAWQQKHTIIHQHSQQKSSHVTPPPPKKKTKKQKKKQYIYCSRHSLSRDRPAHRSSHCLQEGEYRRKEGVGVGGAGGGGGG